jgi:hypothetical protein
LALDPRGAGRQGVGMNPIDFIIAAETGELSQEEFDQNVQAFVDSGVWRSLQGSWQRAVHAWAEAGLVTINN